jgi:hypothetical protein
MKMPLCDAVRRISQHLAAASGSQRGWYAPFTLHGVTAFVSAHLKDITQSLAFTAAGMHVDVSTLRAFQEHSTSDLLLATRSGNTVNTRYALTISTLRFLYAASMVYVPAVTGCVGEYGRVILSHALSQAAWF